MHARTVVALAALALLAALAFLLRPLPGTLAPGSVRPTAAESVGAESRAGPQAFAPQADTAVDRSAVATVAQPSEATEPADARRWVVRGTVSGAPALQGPPARLRARFVGLFHIEGALEAELA